MQSSDFIVGLGVLLFGVAITAVIFIVFEEEDGSSDPYEEVSYDFPVWVWVILGLSLFIILGSIVVVGYRKGLA